MIRRMSQHIDRFLERAQEIPGEKKLVEAAKNLLRLANMVKKKDQELKSAIEDLQQWLAEKSSKN